jgi:hypothetical protein
MNQKDSFDHMEATRATRIKKFSDPSAINHPYAIA